MEERVAADKYRGEDRRRRWPVAYAGEDRRMDPLAFFETDQEPDQSAPGPLAQPSELAKGAAELS